MDWSVQQPPRCPQGSQEPAVLVLGHLVNHAVGLYGEHYPVRALCDILDAIADRPHRVRDQLDVDVRV